jgi:hypothetical protein
MRLVIIFGLPIIALEMASASCRPRNQAAVTTSEKPNTSATNEIFVEEVDMNLVRTRVMAAGARFTELFNEPMPFLTDFIGYQIVQKVDRTSFKKDFQSLGAVIIKESPASVIFRLGGGAQFEYKDSTTLRIAGGTAEVPYIKYSTENAETINFIEAMKELRGIIRSVNLLKRYTVSNPFYELEVKAKALQNQELPTIEQRQDVERFSLEKNAVIVVQDIHEERVHYDYVLKKIHSGSVDWVGIEMLSVDLQSKLDDFLKKPEDSAEFLIAKTELLRYYKNAWHSRFDTPSPDPEQNPYFQLLKMARSKKIQIYAMDAPQSYIAFRYGEFDLAMVTRNMIWANSLPGQGRGILFGGAGHFTKFKGATTLYFLKQRNPDVVFFSASDLASR